MSETMPEFVIEVSQDGGRVGYVGPTEAGGRLSDEGGELIAKATFTVPTVTTIREAQRWDDAIKAENNARLHRRQSGASIGYRVVEAK